jgi:cytochrome c biogenesis protein CcmG/thiol:disulfide interchange protein DsbE
MAEMHTPAFESPDDAAAAHTPPRRPSRLLFALPVLAFIGLAITFIAGLNYDPHLVPSPLIGRRVPSFDLPPVGGHKRGLSSADLKGRVSLVNVFASWCVSCRDEHPLLLALKQKGIVPIEGIDYKDAPADAARWLAAMGDPYSRIGADVTGRVAIDWGVYGVPETFVVGPDGHIAYKQVGPVTVQVLERKILPLVAALRRGLHPRAGTGE